MSYANPERLVCDDCGGEDVTEDATVAWDTLEQKWVVEYVHDYCWCSDCDNHVSTEFVPIDDLKHKAVMTIKKEEKDGI